MPPTKSGTHCATSIGGCVRRTPCYRPVDPVSGRRRVSGPTGPLFTVLHSFLQPHTNHRRRGGDSFNVESAVAENGNAATVLMEDVGEQSQSQVVLDGIDASQLDVVFEDSQASNSQASNASSPADAEVTAAVGNGQPGTVAANRSAATEAAARPEPDRRPVGSQPATLEPPARATAALTNSGTERCG
ncbi:hypothetical protein FJT64_003902 [Amphibalanus amphitrite]|uniref:Uncharacterized protein n=1 Tax=Amphibalanus amphitrite TaxID=1232801 RepID=A0A6A4W6Z7_AMPAM|nr:hypothetical protein FJT64_003902 [Amphibalanus amphitrite]